MMVALLSALIFSAAFVVSVWAMFVTIAPRLDYMRALLSGGDAVPAQIPAAAVRARVTRPAAISTMGRPALRAAA